MMNKKKSFLGLGLYLIISFVLIITAIVVSLTAGINLGTEIGGGTQFEIAIDGTVASKTQIQTVKDVLHENKLHAEKIFVEDKDVDTLIVVRIAEKNLKNQAEIRADLVEKLGVKAEDISSFSTINGVITKKSVLWTSIAIVCLLLAIFVAGWLRYKVVAGLSLMFVVLHALMINVSMLVLTRLPITMIALIEILCAVILVLVAFVLFLEKVRENSLLKHNDNISTEELVSMSQKSILKPLIFMTCLVLIFTIALMCIPVRFVTLSACALLVAIASAVYSYYFVGILVHKKLLELKVQADKLRLSRNESPAPKKETKKTSKKIKETEN